METKESRTTDPDNYIGMDVELVKAEFINTQFGAALKVTSEPIELKGDDKMPEGKPLTASKIFGLIEDDGKVYIPKEGVLQKFLESKNLTTDIIPEFSEGNEIPAMAGLMCKVQKNSKGYLEVT